MQLHLASSLIYSLQLGFPPSFWVKPIIAWLVWSNNELTRVLAPKRQSSIWSDNLKLGEAFNVEVRGRCRGVVWWWLRSKWGVVVGKTRWFWSEWWWWFWEGRDKQGWYLVFWPGSTHGVDWAGLSLGLGGLEFGLDLYFGFWFNIGSGLVLS